MQPNERPHTARRRVAFALVVGAVLLLHALATQGVMDHLRDKRQEQGSSIKRMEATLLDDMVLSDPPVVAAPAPAEQAVAPLEDEPPAAASRAASKA